VLEIAVCARCAVRDDPLSEVGEEPSLDHATIDDKFLASQECKVEVEMPPSANDDDEKWYMETARNCRKF